MDDHSVMLEHTLVLAGEVVDSGMVWQGWPCTKQFSLEAHRRSVRAHLEDLTNQRMARRDKSRREEQMFAAAFCWPCTALSALCSSGGGGSGSHTHAGTGNREYDRLSLLEEASTTTSFSTSDKAVEMGMSHSSSRNLLHLKERSNSFMMQTQDDSSDIMRNNGKSALNGNGNGNGNNGSRSKKTTDAEGIIYNKGDTPRGDTPRGHTPSSSVKVVPIQPLGTSSSTSTSTSNTPLLGKKKGIDERKDSYGTRD